MKGLPLEKGIIYETIVSTFNDKGKPNAAPMGVSINSAGDLILRTFYQTDTYQNLHQSKICIINLTCNPELYVICALFQDELPEDTFEIIPEINAPVLKECNSRYIAAEVKNEMIELERAIFECKIVQLKIVEGFNPPYTRAFSSLIEILIHATRVIHFSKTEGPASPKVARLRELIKHNANIIERVSYDNQTYNQLVDKVLDKISSEVEKLPKMN